MAKRRRQTLMGCRPSCASIHHWQLTSVNGIVAESPVVRNGHAGCARGAAEKDHALAGARQSWRRVRRSDTTPIWCAGRTGPRCGIPTSSGAVLAARGRAWHGRAGGRYWAGVAPAAPGLVDGAAHGDAEVAVAVPRRRPVRAATPCPRGVTRRSRWGSQSAKAHRTLWLGAAGSLRTSVARAHRMERCEAGQSMTGRGRRRMPAALRRSV